MLLSVETLASLLGLSLLATGWILAALGNSACRWLYLVAAIVAGFPIPELLTYPPVSMSGSACSVGRS